MPHAQVEVIGTDADAMVLQRAILERIAAVFLDGVYLVIGAHDQLPNGNRSFEPVIGSPQIFRKAHNTPCFSERIPDLLQATGKGLSRRSTPIL